MTLIPRLRAALVSMSCSMLLVPDVATTDLPLKSSIRSSLFAFFEMKLVAVRKWVWLKATCRCRSGLLVVEPHSRSMVPFASKGMRVDDEHRHQLDHEPVELELLLHGVDNGVA